MDLIKFFFISLFISMITLCFVQAIFDQKEDAKVKNLERRVHVLERKYYLQTEEISILREDYYKISRGTYTTPAREEKSAISVASISKQLVNNNDCTRKIESLTKAFQQEKHERLSMQVKLNKLEQKCENQGISTEYTTQSVHTTRNDRTSGPSLRLHDYAEPKMEGEYQNTQVGYQNTPKIAFSAGINGTSRLTGLYHTIIFDEITENDGDAYSSETGQFVAPVSGTYVFHLDIFMVHLITNKTLVHVIQNDQVLRLVPLGKDTPKDSSMIVVHLEPGDIVENKSNEDLIILLSKFCNFSGFLLYAD